MLGLYAMGQSQKNSGINKKYKRVKEENKKLKEKLREKEKQSQLYRKELVNNSILERWKIGKYLHDNLAQQLISAKISISSLKQSLSKENFVETCDEIIDIIDASIRDVRDLSHDIIPMDVEKEGSGEAFTYLKNQVERQHEVTCTLETEEILEKINRREVATNLYNIAQEAIKNAVVHGEAKNIKIAVIEHEEQLYLHIKDDGKGFEYEQEQGGGMGISIMEHRAEEMGGSLKIKDAKDEEYTTCVTCSLPLEALKGD